MNMNFYTVLKNKWEQVCFEVERNSYPPYGNKVFKSRIPVSGILYDKMYSSTSQSSLGILLSALPESGVAVKLQTWDAPEVPTDIVAFDGMPLCELGFPVAPYEMFRINPFVKKVNLYVLKPALVSKLVSSVDNITDAEFSSIGICYEPQKSVAPSATECFEFFHCIGKRLRPNSSKGAFTSFSVKVETDVQISFWGAPVLTASGKVQSIVVYQRSLGAETVAIVGMDIDSFVNIIPSPEL